MERAEDRKDNLAAPKRMAETTTPNPTLQSQPHVAEPKLAELIDFMDGEIMGPLHKQDLREETEEIFCGIFGVTESLFLTAYEEGLAVETFPNPGRLDPEQTYPWHHELILTSTDELDYDGDALATAFDGAWRRMHLRILDCLAAKATNEEPPALSIVRGTGKVQSGGAE